MGRRPTVQILACRQADALGQGDAATAMRYQCPVTGSLVLITDEPTLGHLAHPRARLRCMDCGETHLLTQGSEDDDAA